MLLMAGVIVSNGLAVAGLRAVAALRDGCGGTVHGLQRLNGGTLRRCGGARLR